MGKFLKLIKIDYMEGIEEPWCNSQGVVLLPFVYERGKYYFLLTKGVNPLFKNISHAKYGTITGGCEKDKTVIETMINELWEETGINIKNNNQVVIHQLGSYYANKNNIKLWHLCAIDLTKLKLNLKATFNGSGDGTIGEAENIGEFVNESGLVNSNDTLGLATYAKLILKNIITTSKKD